ncbi:glutathione S-transferase U17-like [Iris pallida]|uniref:glutathione transferase n=1 Tax=Iris pallida TaxID=29817 RepID=A0AAX6F6P5_IRIPA|nr:glutathione S-transferase U17-like [Iris pallida]
MATSGTGEEVKLLGVQFSPFVIRARIALNLKGVGYEFLEEVFGKKSELLLKSNPVYKKMPVLIHGGKPICESMIIVQYIDDAWDTTGPSILPSDPYERATARFWTTYMDDKLFPFMGQIIKAKTEAAKVEAVEQFAPVLQLLDGAFEKCSQGKGFFGGDAIGYVDIALGSFLRWLTAIEELSGLTILAEEKTPGLIGWAERFYSAEAVKEVLPETEKFVEFGKVVQAALLKSEATD